METNDCACPLFHTCLFFGSNASVHFLRSIKSLSLPPLEGFCSSPHRWLSTTLDTHGRRLVCTLQIEMERPQSRAEETKPGWSLCFECQVPTCQGHLASLHKQASEELTCPDESSMPQRLSPCLQVRGTWKPGCLA